MAIQRVSDLPNLEAFHEPPFDNSKALFETSYDDGAHHYKSYNVTGN